jgi:hypothetical protein
MVLSFAKKSLFSLALVAGLTASMAGLSLPRAEADLSPRARTVIRDATIGAAVGTGVGLVRTSNWWNSGNYNDRYYGGDRYNNRYYDDRGHRGRGKGHYRHHH